MESDKLAWDSSVGAVPHSHHSQSLKTWWSPSTVNSNGALLELTCSSLHIWSTQTAVLPIIQIHPHGMKPLCMALHGLWTSVLSDWSPR